MDKWVFSFWRLFASPNMYMVSIFYFLFYHRRRKVRPELHQPYGENRGNLGLLYIRIYIKILFNSLNSKLKWAPLRAVVKQSKDVNTNYIEDKSITMYANIMQTCPYNVYPITPHFYIVKLGFTEVFHYVNVSVLIKFSQKTSVFILIIISSQ